MKIIPVTSFRAVHGPLRRVTDLTAENELRVHSGGRFGLAPPAYRVRLTLECGHLTKWYPQSRSPRIGGRTRCWACK